MVSSASRESKATRLVGWLLVIDINLCKLISDIADNSAENKEVKIKSSLWWSIRYCSWLQQWVLCDKPNEMV